MKSKSTETKPSIVFCHGLWADGSCFSKVIPALQADGHQVIAAQYALNTTADDDATVKNTLGRVSSPANLISSSSDSRTEMSSSTTKTIGFCCDFAAAAIVSVQILKSTRLQRGVECLQEIRGLERLEQTVHSALGDQTWTNRFISLGRDEDDRD